MSGLRGTSVRPSGQALAARGYSYIAARPGRQLQNHQAPALLVLLFQPNRHTQNHPCGGHLFGGFTCRFVWLSPVGQGHSGRRQTGVQRPPSRLRSEFARGQVGWRRTFTRGHRRFGTCGVHGGAGGWFVFSHDHDAQDWTQCPRQRHGGLGGGGSQFAQAGFTHIVQTELAWSARAGVRPIAKQWAVLFARSQLPFPFLDLPHSLGRCQPAHGLGQRDIGAR